MRSDTEAARSFAIFLPVSGTDVPGVDPQSVKPDLKGFGMSGIENYSLSVL